MSSTNRVFNFISGIAAGAAIGVLFAPEKGSKTRKQISDKTKKVSDNVKQKINDATGYVADNYANAVNKTEALVSEGKSKFNEVKNEVKHAENNKSY